MKASTLVIAISATIILLVSAAFAGLEFKLDRSFTIPQLTGSIQQMRFGDLDRDGIPKVLARDAGRIVLYSISLDSVLFFATPDSGYQLSAIELADVDRDSLADIVATFCAYTSYRISDPWATFAGTRTVVKCFTGSSSYLAFSQDSLDGVTVGAPFAFCAAADLNLDGYKELLVSTDTTYYYNYYPDVTYYTLGKSRCYRDFPDSISWEKHAFVTGMNRLQWGDGSATYWTNNHFDYYNRKAEDLHSNGDIAFVLDSAGGLISLPGLYHFCTGGSMSSYSKVLCAGDLDGNTDTHELLMSIGISYYCGGPIGQSGGNSYIRMYRFTPPATCEQVWSVDLAGMNYQDYAFHPALPGYFLALSADTLLLIQGSDGTIKNKSTRRVPSGKRSWDYPYSDNVPRLVVTNNSQVSFYELDTNTDAGNDSGHSLPGSFVLGRPYPNPFNAELLIPVTLFKSSDLNVDLFNIAGELVTHLHRGRAKAGENLIRWNASGAASGVYLIRAQTSKETRSVKAVLLK